MRNLKKNGGNSDSNCHGRSSSTRIELEDTNTTRRKPDRTRRQELYYQDTWSTRRQRLALNRNGSILRPAQYLYCFKPHACSPRGLHAWMPHGLHAWRPHSGSDDLRCQQTSQVVFNVNMLMLRDIIKYWNIIIIDWSKILWWISMGLCNYRS
jgi:hypothetical protein